MMWGLGAASAAEVRCRKCAAHAPGLARWACRQAGFAGVGELAVNCSCWLTVLVCAGAGLLVCCVLFCTDLVWSCVGVAWACVRQL